MHRFPSFGCTALEARSIFPPSATALPHLAGLPSVTSSMLPLLTRFFAAWSAFGLSSARATATANTRIAANDRTFFDMDRLLKKTRPGPLRQVFRHGVVRNLVPAPLVQLHRLRVVAKDVQANAPDPQALRLVVKLG